MAYHGSPRILRWVTYPFSRGSYWPENWTRVSCMAGRFFTAELLGKPPHHRDQHKVSVHQSPFWVCFLSNLDSILKSRDITSPTKVRLVKAMVFPVVIYGCESWTIKKAEHQRIDAVELWYWRRLLRVPWTARRSNQSILKEISPGYSLEGLMLKLKLQYFGTSCGELTHWKRLWFMGS